MLLWRATGPGRKVLCKVLRKVLCKVLREVLREVLSEVLREVLGEVLDLGDVLGTVLEPAPLEQTPLEQFA